MADLWGSAKKERHVSPVEEVLNNCNGTPQHFMYVQSVKKEGLIILNTLDCLHIGLYLYTCIHDKAGITYLMQGECTSRQGILYM